MCYGDSVRLSVTSDAFVVCIEMDKLVIEFCHRAQDGSKPSIRPSCSGRDGWHNQQIPSSYCCTGPPFRGSAIPGIRVRVRVGLRLSLADLRNGGPESLLQGVHKNMDYFLFSLHVSRYLLTCTTIVYMPPAVQVSLFADHFAIWVTHESMHKNRIQ